MQNIHFLLIALCFVSGCSADKTNAVPVARIGCEEVKEQVFPESADQLPKLEEDALAGSSNAAIALSHWYFLHRDEIKREYWTRVAAENGSVVGKHNLGMLYVRKEPTKLNRIRARYWLLEAKKCGSKYADIELKDMDEQDKVNAK